MSLGLAFFFLAESRLTLTYTCRLKSVGGTPTTVQGGRGRLQWGGEAIGHRSDFSPPRAPSMVKGEGRLLGQDPFNQTP